MQSKALTVENYLNELPEERREIITQLRNTVLKNLPKGFEEQMSGMIGYNVPFSIYPAGYHCTPTSPLPFMGIASQKNHIAFYHMGIYAQPELFNWFVAEYPKYTKTKPDMGKSCIRWKKPEQVPVKLIGELVKKMSVKEWISIYESVMKK